METVNLRVFFDNFIKNNKKNDLYNLTQNSIRSFVSSNQDILIEKKLIKVEKIITNTKMLIINPKGLYSFIQEKRKGN